MQQGLAQVIDNLAAGALGNTVLQIADHVRADIGKALLVEGCRLHHVQQPIQQHQLLVVVAADPQADALGVLVDIKVETCQQGRVGELVDRVLQQRGVERRCGRLGSTLSYRR